MRFGVFKELSPGETRVALVPDAVKQLLKKKHSVSVESGAGLAASIPDSEFAAAGAEVVADARVEPSLAGGNSGAAVQFERLGYFCPDKDFTPANPVFNRTVGLRDSYAKVAAN